MEPIVNPWYFYLMGLSGSISFIACLGAVFSGILFFIGLCIKVASICDRSMEDDWKKLSKTYRAVKILLVVLLFIAIAVPSKETLVQMVVAQQVTPKNVEKAISAGKNLKDELKKDVIDIIQAVSKEEKEKKEKK